MHQLKASGRANLYSETSPKAKQNIMESTKLHKMIARAGWNVGVLFHAFNCMLMQAEMHQMQAVGKSCSAAKSAEHQVTLGWIAVA